MVRSNARFRLRLRRLVAAALWALPGLGGSVTAVAQPKEPSELQVAVWASSCMACHGPDGKAEGTGLSLHGRSADDLLGKLLAYRSGQIKGTVMGQHARGYSDAELRRIAQHLARLK